jgi:hypothetical protein
MKYNTEAGETMDRVDLDPQSELVHTAETHVYPAQDETSLTLHGSCPHCDEEGYRSRGRSGFWLISSLSISPFALMILGYASTANIVLLSTLVWFVALESVPKQLHKALSRVGL